MQVIACGEARRTAFTDDLLLLHHLPWFYIDLTHVAIERHQSGAVVDQHGIAVDAKVFRKHDFPIVARFDRSVLYDRQIESNVILLINWLAVVNVGPPVSEVRFHLRVAQLHKRAVPEKFAGRVLRQFRDPGVDLPPQVTVDFHEILDLITLVFEGRRVRHDLGDDLPHKAVFERNIALQLAFVKDVLPVGRPNSA